MKNQIGKLPDAVAALVGGQRFWTVFSFHRGFHGGPERANTGGGSGWRWLDHKSSSSYAEQRKSDLRYDERKH